MKYNLTIDGTNNYVKIDYLNEALSVTGTDYFSFSHLIDEKDGWYFNRPYNYEHRTNKFLFADIVLLNTAPIGATTQAQVTALLVAAISV